MSPESTSIETVLMSDLPESDPREPLPVDQSLDLSMQTTSPPGAAALPKIVSFKSLARCGEEIWIENDGQIYRLRRTRQGKLILTK